jgi:hypothetical protein
VSGIRLNAALTPASLAIVQAPLPEQKPLQLSNLSAISAGVAVRVTVTPTLKSAVQEAVQLLIPAGELDTLPGPVTETLTVKVVGTGGSVVGSVRNACLSIDA